MLGFHIVPDNEVHIIICLGNRPPESGDGGIIPGIASEIALPGLHWYIPLIHKNVASLPINPVDIYLFRHDKKLPSEPPDTATLELKDTLVSVQITVVAQIKKTPKGNISRKNIWKAYYQSQNNDFLRTVETLINPLARSALQGTFYEIPPEKLDNLPDKENQIAKGNVDYVGVSNISPSNFLKRLGLRYPHAHEGLPLKLNDSGQDASTKKELVVGRHILNSLAEIGVELTNIVIDDIALPTDVANARAERAKQKALAQAELDKMQIQQSIIEQEMKNLQARRTGEVEALKIQSQGFVDAIRDAASSSGGMVSAEVLTLILGQYPALSQVISDKAQFFFSGGSGGDQINVNPLIQAINAGIQSSESHKN